MVKGVIFDFDGVIVDTEPGKFAALRKAAGQEGLAIGDDRFAAYVSKKRGFFLEQEFPTLPSPVRERILLAARKDDKMIVGEARIIPGLKELLDFLQGKHVALAIATGSGRAVIERTLRTHALSRYFPFIISGEDFSSSKPDPECFRLALRRMDLRPSEAIIVEDSTAGIAAAKRFGCEVYGLATSLPEEALREADDVFKDHRDIFRQLRTRF